MCGAVPIRDDTTPGIAGQVEEATSIAGPSRAAGGSADNAVSMSCSVPKPAAESQWVVSVYNKHPKERSSDSHLI